MGTSKFMVRIHEADQTKSEITKLWEKLQKVEIKGLPLKPQSAIEGMAMGQELNAEQKRMLSAWICREGWHKLRLACQHGSCSSNT